MKNKMIIALTLFSFFTTIHAPAFIGNSLLGSNYCAFACGRGPLGVAPVGDILKGANELAFGPTLDAFEQKGKNIVDYASEKADAKLLTLDKSLEQKLGDITELAQDSIAQLDNVLQSNITMGIEGLSRQVESLDLVGTKQNDQLNSLIRGLVYLVAFTVFIIWLAKYMAAREGSLQARFRKVRWRALAALLAMILIVVSPNFIGGLKYKIPPMKADLDGKYGVAFTRLSYPASTFIAEKLVLITPDSKELIRNRDRSKALRNAFYNPLSYRTIEGLRTTEVGLASLLIPEASMSQIDNGMAVKFLDEPELEITLAMIAWQVRQDIPARLQAANISAHIIERQMKLIDKDRTQLLPLVIHYLSSYLLNPIDDKDIGLVVSDTSLSINSDIYSFNYPLKTLAQMKVILVQAVKTPAPANPSNEKATLLRQINFGSNLAEAYRIAIPSYVEMLNLNFLARSANPEIQKILIGRRNLQASVVIGSWDEIIASSDNPHYYDTNLRLALIDSLSATYERSVQYSAQATFDVPPMISEAKYEQLPINSFFHKKWIERMAGAVRPSGLPFLRFRSKLQFFKDQEELLNFENAYYEFLGNPTDVEKALIAAEAAAKLGLFVCSSKQAAEQLSNVDIVDCKLEGAQPMNIVWYVYSRLPSEQKIMNEKWNSAFQNSLKRPVPII